MVRRPLLTLMLFIPYIIGYISCTSDQGEKMEVPEGYRSGIMEWRKDRYEYFTDENSWLALEGLYWLEEGINTVGSDVMNHVVLPEALPTQAGTFLVTGDQVWYTRDDTTVQVSVEKGDRFRVIPDTEEGTHWFGYDPYAWVIIERGGRFGLRLWNNESDRRTEFKGIEYFDVDADWRIKARVVRHHEKVITVDNEVGMRIDMRVPATLEFEYGGEQYTLDAFEGGDDQWFVILADATTGKTTYGAGRYLYVRIPEEGEEAVIDFNRIYNPPCAYTEYATCLLPPPGNVLEFAITAGEKYE